MTWDEFFLVGGLLGDPHMAELKREALQRLREVEREVEAARRRSKAKAAERRAREEERQRRARARQRWG